MTGKAVLEHSHSSHFTNPPVNNTAQLQYEVGGNGYSPIEVATIVTFTVALFQVIKYIIRKLNLYIDDFFQILMYIFRLGIISTLLSETLVSGFTTGAAFQVLTSQIKDLFGLSIPKQKGFFVVVNVKYILSKKCIIYYIQLYFLDVEEYYWTIKRDKLCGRYFFCRYHYYNSF